METGFLSKHDHEYFSTDIYDQSNGFESENSVFNGLINDYDLVESSPLDWIDTEINIHCDRKEEKEDFQKTFQEWQSHINALQSKDDGELRGIDSGIDLYDSTFLDKIIENPKSEDENCLKKDFASIVTIKEENFKNEAIENSFEKKFPPEIEFPLNNSTVDLGPDNYEVVEISIEEEEVKTTIDNNSGPVFLPTENKNNLWKNTLKDSLDIKTELTVEQIKTEPTDEQILNIKQEGQLLLQDLAKRTITEVLPKEVIERIKDSSKKKKGIAIIPATKLNCKKNEQLIDAGASRNLFRLEKHKTNKINEGRTNFDHDYCTNDKKQTSLLSSIKNVTHLEVHLEKNSKKDSGLESGEVSDASESTPEKQFSTLKQEEPCKDGIDIQPKKKKLNLEEYRSRRKNLRTKSKSPEKIQIKIESDTIGAESAPKKVCDENNTRVMVNAEVQTQVEFKPEDDNRKYTDSHKSRRRNKTRRRRRTKSRSSSRSSSSDSRRYRGSRYRSRSRSRQRWSSRSSRSHSRSRSSSSSHSRSRSRNLTRYHRSRSRSNFSNVSSFSRYSKRLDDWSPVEKQKQVEERRVVYVGQIAEGTTKTQLRERFQKFGPIVDISLHFRERGDNYGFVTFMYKVDAYDAVEHGNDNQLEPQYDICFGGRRAFCKQRYADLDSTPQNYNPYQPSSRNCDSFDALLKQAKESLRKQQKLV